MAINQAAGKQAAESEGSIFSRGSRYVSESLDELKKIHSPTRQETIQATVVTMVIVVFISAVVAMMDLIFGWVTRMIL